MSHDHYMFLKHCFLGHVTTCLFLCVSVTTDFFSLKEPLHYRCEEESLLWDWTAHIIGN